MMNALKAHPARWAGVLAVVLVLLVVLLWPSSEPEPEVPPVAELPDPGPMPDFAAIDQVGEMKDAFFDYLLPVVQAQNEWIVGTRGFLERTRDRLQDGEALSRQALERLQALAPRYRVQLDEPPSVDNLETLLDRVDLIPPSLALAQAAAESGWGRSRFAREGNNLFGEWCFTSGCGLVPQRRISGATHEVAAFESVAGSIDSYFRNLNSHPAYKPMRDLRAQARREQGGFLGPDLVPGLGLYSERGQDYLHELQLMIRANDLTELDVASPAAPEDAEAAETAQR